jgi:hypothetical protein
MLSNDGPPLSRRSGLSMFFPHFSGVAKARLNSWGGPFLFCESLGYLVGLRLSA